MTSSTNNGKLGQLLTDLRNRSSRRKTLRRVAYLVTLLTAALLLMLATGCVSRQPIPCEPPPPIAMPVVPLSAPTVSYSMQLAGKLKDWQSLLMLGQSKP